MTERGVVVKVKGKRATVRFDRRSACDSCHMCAVTRDGMKVEVVIENTLGANVGDFVEVEMAQRFVLTAAIIVYLIPLALVAFGVGLGVLFNELTQILLAVGGLVLGFVIAFLLDRFVIKKKKGFSPQMKAICLQTADEHVSSSAEAQDDEYVYDEQAEQRNDSQE
ncbi:MAG: SoxR reducing system RseC family protein [Clostridia bacterium]|nr:SoxR reducing system RseC family protein [Clostridia bacterium]